ncbi:inositol monophosphatase family protein [Pseudoponticoccus marisrubri]|uniref:3'(2'),5'-bisphosphate nucleotidase CysQ n=1 Tax=Pseudoponticoccus marisrubri TaxID=1685382 RepID=A0A0W7WQ91_9RHOB|nr:3'(2'),5'-bisphosphate nucleotidase CysQ [Pseudoponticoccus marisrubri]KUF12746.1 3'(2'),5'-bisphosphate nucleotidase CysQ [Pseudoponticoccus marisrubri]
MPANDLALLIDAARKAAETALAYVGGPLDVRNKPADDTPVTAADLAVNAVLHDMLRDARPDYGWLSEESEADPGRHTARRTFVVDPIDGTRAFIEGQRAWAHALAVVEDGAVIAAVVHLPVMDKLYAAARGGGARLNGKPISVGRVDAPARADVLATRPSMEAHHWPGGVPPVTRSYRPSLAYRLSLVAEGRFDAMFTFRPTWEWDIAAGSLLLSEAGARVTDRRGGRLSFNAAHPQADGVLAANPDLHAALLDRLI